MWRLLEVLLMLKRNTRPVMPEDGEGGSDGARDAARQEYNQAAANFRTFPRDLTPQEAKVYGMVDEELWIQGAVIWQTATTTQEAKNRAAFVIFGALLEVEFVTDELATVNTAMARVRGVSMKSFGGDYGKFTALFSEVTTLLKEVDQYTSNNQEEMKTIFMGGLDAETGRLASAYFEKAEDWEDLRKKLRRPRITLSRSTPRAGTNKAAAAVRAGYLKGQRDAKAAAAAQQAGGSRARERGHAMALLAAEATRPEAKTNNNVHASRNAQVNPDEVEKLHRQVADMEKEAQERQLDSERQHLEQKRRHHEEQQLM